MGGMPNFGNLGAMFNNPNFMNMAQQMMNNPAIQQMMQDPNVSRM